MAYKLIVTKEAHSDIDEIASYIAKEFKNATSTASFLNDVEKSYRLIIDNPCIYALCTDERLHERGYRKVVIKHYLVLYRVDEADKTVYVVRVVYGARDYAKLL